MTPKRDTHKKTPAAQAKKPAVRTTPAKQPTAVRFFLADDIREDAGGKVTAVGLYGDNVIVIELPHGAADPTPEQVAALSGISILASVSTTPGDHRYELAIEPASAVPPLVQAQTSVVNTPAEGATVNLIVRLAPLPFTRFGMAHVVLNVDGDPHRFSFEIRRKNTAA